MPRERLVTKIKRRLLGVAFLALVVGLVGLSIAAYNHAFSTYVTITLDTDHTGNQLQTQSDVKVRGLLVGSVRSISSTGDGARVTLDIYPDKASLIPSNVSAQLLPKTLFGERYVALELPPDPARAIHNGDVIAQDHSTAAIEVQTVLADLMPVLTAVKPAELNATLNALATALSGRGAELGHNIDQLDAYLRGLNPSVPTLVDDVDKLGKVALEYNNAAPDLLATLSNLQTTSATITSQATSLNQLLLAGTGAGNVLDSFLDDNGSRLITVAAQSSQVLDLLSEYTPEYRCMLAGLAQSETSLEKVFVNDRLHITLEVVKERGKYVQGDQAVPVTGIGPKCYGLPDPADPFQPPPNLNDGAAQYGGPSSGSQATAQRLGYDQSGVGTAAETAMVNALVAQTYGTTPDEVPGITTVLVAPLLRGTQVDAG